MARWTSGTWEQFGQGFRRRTKQEKFGWPTRLIRYSSLFLAAMAGQVIDEWIRHRIDHSFAVTHVEFAAFGLVALVVCLGWMLRSSEADRHHAFEAALFGCAGAVIALCLCFPKL